MTHLPAHPATPPSHRLAEGPFWDPPTERLLWVDIDDGAVRTGRLLPGPAAPTGSGVRAPGHGTGPEIEIGSTLRVDTTVGAVVPGPGGTLLVAGATHLGLVGPDGTRTAGPEILPTGEHRRLNDGACDPAGRFLVGSMSLAGDSEQEVLRRLEDDGSVTTLDDDLALSNGLTWSPDGATLYSVDTLRGVVHARGYDVATGAVGPRRTHLRLDDELPDGLCTDEAGNLWVAVYGAGQVRCFTPDGALLHTVDVGPAATTSVAFAGRDLGTLVVTTAADAPGTEPHHAWAGALLTVDVAGATGLHGLPVPAWNGRGLRRAAPDADASTPGPAPHEKEH